MSIAEAAAAGRIDVVDRCDGRARDGAASAQEPDQPGEGLLAPAQTHWIHEGPAGRGAGPVTDDMLKNAPADPATWLHFGGNYASWRHSPIKTLTPASLKDLRVAWMLPTGVSVQLEVSPIVYDGILYATASHNRLFAARRGDRQAALALRPSAAEGPAHLLRSGQPRRGDRRRQRADGDARRAPDRVRPQVGEDRVEHRDRSLRARAVGDLGAARRGRHRVVGIAGGEYGVRGFFDGYDVKTGERRWRHFTVPVEGEPGVETWAGDSWKSGGAPTWVTGSYDPATDTLFWATGNPSPDWNGDLREGDNLYSDSVLAVDPKTGKRKWHFQFMPHDVWDYDGNSELFLVDVDRGGQKVPALAQANRNGYFYLLDRRDGKFLFAKQYADQVNWAKVDAKGRPLVDPKMVPADEGETAQRVCPGLAGGKQGSYTGAFNPDLGLAFLPVIESCMQFKKGIVVFLEGVPFLGGEPIGVDAAEGKAYGHLSAIDVATGEEKWRYKDPYPMMGGVLSTAGGAVITGNMEGTHPRLRRGDRQGGLALERRLDHPQPPDRLPARRPHLRRGRRRRRRRGRGDRRQAVDRARRRPAGRLRAQGRQRLTVRASASRWRSASRRRSRRRTRADDAGAAPSGPLRVCFLEDDAPRAQRASGRGFDLDVMKAVAADAGVTLEPVWTPSRSGFSEIESSDLPLGRLARGECDAAASVPGADSLGRLRDQLALSRPYYGAAFELIAAAGRSVDARGARRPPRRRPAPELRAPGGAVAAPRLARAAVAGRDPGAARRGRGGRGAGVGSRAGDAGPRAAASSGRRRARYAGTSTSRCAGDRRGCPRSIARSSGSRASGALERLAREHGIPPRAPFETVSDASALAELRREHEVAKQ